MSIEWRPVPDYEDYYEVSSDGRLRSKTRFVKHSSGAGVRLVRGKELAYSVNKKTGYATRALYKDGASKTFLIHRIVASAFPEICGKMWDGCDIDHINTVRLDNRATNLRVCSRSENHLNPITNERMRAASSLKRKGLAPWNKDKKMPWRMGANHPRHKAIRQLTPGGDIVARYDSVADASRSTGIRANAISNNLSGRCRICGGYVFQYERGDCVVNL